MSVPPPRPDNVWSPWSQFTTSTVYPSAFSLFRNKVGNMMTHWDCLAETAFHLPGSPLTARSQILKELSAIGRILNICAERAKAHPEYVSVLCDALRICG